MRDGLIMAKPAGPRCNLRCSYCYYLAKEQLFPADSRRMADDLLERYIAQRLQTAPGPNTHFEWHGGEPTILGLDYFRRIVELQRKHVVPGRSITNGLQTNSVLLDDAWLDFLAAESFNVGLSLDGPADLHDGFRTDAAGRPTHRDVVRAFQRLARRRVRCDVLCVLHAENVRVPLRLYGFFRELGVRLLQFLPLVEWRAEAPAGVSPRTARPEAMGDFLCQVFDEWIGHDLGRMVVQFFDETMRPAAGLPHALCIFRETCGDVAVLPYPELKEKLAILNYCVGVAQALGVARPKVALIAATEQVLPKVQSTVDAAVIAKMAERGQIKGAFVDGPMALDVAIDPESARTKGIAGDVAGESGPGITHTPIAMVKLEVISSSVFRLPQKISSWCEAATNAG